MNRKPDKRQSHHDTILTKWDESLSPDQYAKLKTLHDRRSFMLTMLKSTVAAGSLPLWGSLTACDHQQPEQQFLQQHPWQTFAAVQQQLFPADGNGPAANDIHATLYLKFVLAAADTDQDDRKFMLDGVKWLNDLSKADYDKPFVAITPVQQDQALKKIATSRAGERWLASLLLYLFEALLSDPVYGGNPDGIGWRWLEHQAGFPRPSVGKRYTELL